MKKRVVKIAAMLLVVWIAGVSLCACGAPAPSGMYDPVDGENYRTGVENAIFAVPAGYTVTMSSNMLAAKGESDSFSLQCRHSDYFYGDLRKNYNELKSELTGLYGDYEEIFREDVKVAGNDALEVRYDLTVAGKDCSYVQYLFYFEKSRFFLFTYCTPKGAVDETLLLKVLGTVSLEKENYTLPDGYRAVENAEADTLLSDRYALYCPDNWVFDFSLGQICMRVPSRVILSNVVFNEIKVGEDFEGYCSAYAARVSPGLDLHALKPLEGYIVSSMYQMSGALKDFKVQPSETGKESESGGEEGEITLDALVSDKDKYLMTYTNEEALTFVYVEFTASLPDHTAHGSGGLFADTQGEDGNIEVPETDFIAYRFRQYFILQDDYLYIFTYTATEDRFKEQQEDALKVIKSFSFKNDSLNP